MEYDYEIVYCKRKDNVAVDSLSRILCAQLLTMQLSTIDANLMDRIKLNWQDSAL